MFTSQSRYYPLGDLVHVDENGRRHTYKERRFVRGEPRLAGRTAVGQGERIDLLAFRTLKAPGLYWRLCDANRVLNPFELNETDGRSLLVPEL